MFMDVLILLLPDNLSKMDACLWDAMHKNESFPQGTSYMNYRRPDPKIYTLHGNGNNMHYAYLCENAISNNFMYLTAERGIQTQEASNYEQIKRDNILSFVE